MGTSMGTPMAPNYANLFMAEFETDLIRSFHEKTGVKPFVWFRYIDDIFFIWTDGDESWEEFISYCQSYSRANNMRSTMTFEVNKSTIKVNFLDVSTELKGNLLSTTLFSKPTDSHLYLNHASNHPKHVLKNLPKGQFIRIRRICSEKAEYFRNSKVLSDFFVKRGYSGRAVQAAINEVALLNRKDLLVDRESPTKDPQTIFVADWHPVLNTLPTVLKRNFHIVENDPVLSNIFRTKPLVAFRRPRTIRNYVVKNDIRRERKLAGAKKCGKCKFCHTLSTKTEITNHLKNITVKLACSGTCTSKGVIYAARCKIHNCIYVGHTGEELRTRFSKHRYDIKSRPSNSELAEHFHQNHTEKDMEVYILQTDLWNFSEREFYEDKWICRLQTQGALNTDLHQYAKDMYHMHSKVLANQS